MLTIVNSLDGVSLLQKRVLSILAAYADLALLANISIRVIAAEAPCSDRSAEVALAELEAIGLIAVSRRGGRNRNSYTLNLSALLLHKKVSYGDNKLLSCSPLELDPNPDQDLMYNTSIYTPIESGQNRPPKEITEEAEEKKLTCKIPDGILPLLTKSDVTILSDLDSDDLPAWVPTHKIINPGSTKREFFDATLKIIEAITGRKPVTERCKVAANAVVSLYSALGNKPITRPTVEQFAADVLLVARAAKECDHALFRCDLRGINGNGQKWGEDRSMTVSSILRIDRYFDRLTEAERWKEAGYAAGNYWLRAEPARVGLGAWNRLLTEIKLKGGRRPPAKRAGDPGWTFSDREEAHNSMISAIYSDGVGGWHKICGMSEKEREHVKNTFIQAFEEAWKKR